MFEFLYADTSVRVHVSFLKKLLPGRFTFNQFIRHCCFLQIFVSNILETQKFFLLSIHLNVFLFVSGYFFFTQMKSFLPVNLSNSSLCNLYFFFFTKPVIEVFEIYFRSHFLFIKIPDAKFVQRCSEFYTFLFIFLLSVHTYIFV